ncbi:Ig-like domain-containing protein [Nocardioides pakistanensis]
MDTHGRIARWGRAAVATAIGITGLTALSAAPAQAAGPVVVSLTFDDGLTAQYNAASILEAHGARGTFYLNSGAIDQRGGGGTMTWNQAKELAAAGHEIGGHTRDHIDITSPALSPEDKWVQLCDDRIRLAQQGFPAHSFAYAAGSFDAEAIELVQACGYQTARKAGGLQFGSPTSADRLPPAGPVDGPYGIRILGGVGSAALTLEGLQTAVETAHTAGGGWLPVLFHRVCSSADPAAYAECMNGSRPIDSSTLDAFVAWLTAPEQVARGISVKTVSEVFNAGQAVPAVAISTPAPATDAESPATMSGTTSVDGSVLVRLYSSSYSKGDPAATVTAQSAGGTWSATVPGTLPPGSYTALASVTSDAGVTGISVPVRFQLVPDTTAPAVRITAPADKTTLTSGTVEIRGTAGREPGDDATVTLRVTPDVVGAAPTTRSVTIDRQGGWATSLPLADGTYTAQVTQRDDADNVGHALVTFTVKTVVADTTDPAVTITNPASGSTVTNTRKPVISGTRGTATGDLAGVTVTLHSGTGSVMPDPDVALGSGNTWTATPKVDLANGDYTVVATQTDQAGNIGTATSTFTVDVATTPPGGGGGGGGTPPPAGGGGGGGLPADTTAPSVSISSPANGSTVSDRPAFSGKAGTGAGDKGSVSLSLFTGTATGGKAAQQLTAQVGKDGSWAVTSAKLAAGTYTAQATQKDDAGNTGTSNAVTFIVKSGVALPVEAMRVDSVTRKVLPQGAQGLVLKVRGAGFADDARAAISGAGVTVRRTQVVGPGTLVLTVDVAEGAPVGARDLTVSAPGLADAVCSGCLRTGFGPRLRAMSGDTVGQGARKAVIRLFGQFGPGVKVTVSGEGVRTRILSRRAKVVRLGLWVAPDAAVGARTLTVTHRDGGRFTCTGCLKVAPAPKAAGMGRKALVRGSFAWLTLRGANFSRSTAVLVRGAGVRVDAVRWIGSGRIRVGVYVAPGARRTARTLVLVDKATKARSVLKGAIRIT